MSVASIAGWTAARFQELAQLRNEWVQLGEYQVQPVARSEVLLGGAGNADRGGGGGRVPALLQPQPQPGPPAVLEPAIANAWAAGPFSRGMLSLSLAPRSPQVPSLHQHQHPHHQHQRHQHQPQPPPGSVAALLDPVSRKRPLDEPTAAPARQWFVTQPPAPTSAQAALRPIASPALAAASSSSGSSHSIAAAGGDSGGLRRSSSPSPPASPGPELPQPAGTGTGSSAAGSALKGGAPRDAKAKKEFADKISLWHLMWPGHGLEPLLRPGTEVCILKNQKGPVSGNARVMVEGTVTDKGGIATPEGAEFSTPSEWYRAVTHQNNQSGWKTVRLKNDLKVNLRMLKNQYIKQLRERCRRPPAQPPAHLQHDKLPAQAQAQAPTQIQPQIQSQTPSQTQSQPQPYPDTRSRSPVDAPSPAPPSPSATAAPATADNPH